MYIGTHSRTAGKMTVIGIRPLFHLLEKKYPQDCAHRNGHGTFCLAVIHI